MLSYVDSYEFGKEIGGAFLKKILNRYFSKLTKKTYSPFVYYIEPHSE